MLWIERADDTPDTDNITALENSVKSLGRWLIVFAVSTFTLFVVSVAVIVAALGR